MAGLVKGDRFPEMNVSTAYRKDVSLRDLLGKRTVIWVLRYIGCTVCHYDVQAAAERYKEIQDRGAEIIFVMQSDQEHVAAAYPEGSLPFEIICDPDQVIYRELEIHPAGSMEELLGNRMEDLKAKGAKAAAMGFSHGDYEGNEQQLPAMFILDADGTVEYAKYAENIVDLPNLDGVLALLG